MKHELGDIVFLKTVFKAVRVTALHSGYYDFQYTGVSLNKGTIHYFDDEDVKEDFFDEAG